MHIQNNEFPKGVEIVGSAIIENPDGTILLVKAPKWRNKWAMPKEALEMDLAEGYDKTILDYMKFRGLE